jgi:glycosyltransferase involved in cell wall biosynthesis
MKILHVSPSFYPTRAYGGTIRSSYGLCRGLTQHGCEVRVLTTDTDGIGRSLEVANDRDVAVSGLQVRYCHKLFRNSVSAGLLRVLGGYIAWADIVHLIAVYSFPTFPTLAYCRRLQKPLVWSPRGSLQRWDGSTRVRLKLLWEKACRNLVVKDRVVLHTTSTDEAEQSQNRFPGVRTVIVRNGVELPENVRKTDAKGQFRITYLGRLHPIKGIECLLDACQMLDAPCEPWHLNIAGSGEPEYANLLKAKVAKLGIAAAVDFLGEISGDAKENLFANSDIVVVPSYVENFGIVIAEALAHGLPVIAGKGTPWRELETNRCGLWVDNNPHALVSAIREIRNMPLGEMGRRGRAWMENEFSWQCISGQMLSVFEDCVAVNRRL